MDPTKNMSPLSSKDVNRSSFRNVVFSSFLEYRTMGKIQNPRSSEKLGTDNIPDMFAIIHIRISCVPISYIKRQEFKYFNFIVSNSVWNVFLHSELRI
jgi:hypothetical protein